MITPVIVRNPLGELIKRSSTPLGGHVCGSGRWPWNLLPTDFQDPLATGDDPLLHNMVMTGQSQATLDTAAGPSGETVIAQAVLGDYVLGISSGKVFVKKPGQSELVQIYDGISISYIWAYSDGQTVLMWSSISKVLIEAVYTGENSFDSVTNLGDLPGRVAQEDFQIWSFVETPNGRYLVAYDTAPSEADNDGTGDRHIWRCSKTSNNDWKIDFTMPDAAIRHFHAIGYHAVTGKLIASYGDWITGSVHNGLLIRSDDTDSGTWSEPYPANSRFSQPTNIYDFGHPTKSACGGDDYTQLTTFDTVTYEQEPALVQLDSGGEFAFAVFRYGRLTIVASRDKRSPAYNTIMVSTDFVNWTTIYQFESTQSGVYWFHGVVDGVLYGASDDGWFELPLPDYDVVKAIQCEPAITNLFPDTDGFKGDGVNTTYAHDTWYSNWSNVGDGESGWPSFVVVNESAPRGNTILRIQRPLDETGSASCESPAFEVTVGDVLHGGLWLKSPNYTPAFIRLVGKSSETSSTTTGDSQVVQLYPNQWRWCPVCPYTVETGTTHVRIRIEVLKFKGDDEGQPNAFIDFGGATLASSPVGSWVKETRNANRLAFVADFAEQWGSFITCYPASNSRMVGADAYVATWQAGDTTMQLVWNDTSTRWELRVSDGTNTETLYTAAAKFERGGQIRFALRRDSNGKIQCAVLNGADLEHMTVDGSAVVTANAYAATGASGKIAYADSDGANGLPCCLADVRLISSYLDNTQLLAEFNRLR